MSRRARTLAGLALLLMAAGQASAQDKPHEPSPAHAPVHAVSTPHKSKAAKPAALSEAKLPSVAKPSAPTHASRPAPPAAAPEAADVKQEAGTQVKVLEFSGLDIEGQLKTPQMLYFLNRLRAEFARPRLPHRSFMPELQRSTQGKSF